MLNQITLHMANHLLRNYFTNKKAMARKLEIPYRSLLRVFNEQSYPGDVQRTMNAIATYYMEQRMQLSVSSACSHWRFISFVTGRAFGGV